MSRQLSELQQDRQNLQRPITQRLYGAREREFGQGLHLHMFREDIIGRIVPYRSGRRVDNTAIIRGTDDQIRRARLLISTLDRQGYDRNDDDIVREAIRNLSQHVLYDVISYFEIIRSDEGEFYGLVSVRPDSFFRFPIVSVQAIPKQFRNSPEFPGGERRLPKLIWIRNRRLWRLTLPMELGGARGFRRMLRAFVRTDRLAPDFTLGANRTSFDFTDYNRAQHEARANASATWGWPERNYELRDVTEYYYFYRELHFRKAIALLRQHILTALNALLSQLRIGARIELPGLHSPQFFQDLLDRLSKGSATFEDVLKIDKQELES